MPDQPAATPEASLPSHREALRWEARDLALVGAGAIPGALLRWRLEQFGLQLDPGLSGLAGADLVANLAGSFLIGVIAAGQRQRPRLMLLAGIGFCGSLTTFSSWILQLAKGLEQGRSLPALGLLLVSVLGGLAAVAAGFAIGGRLRSAVYGLRR